MKLVGYWFALGPPAMLTLPRPQRLVDPRWTATARRAAVAYLRAGRTYQTYPSSSWCRFRCGATARELGRRELTDGDWAWPDGLAHYVEVHGVRLPPALLARVAGGGSGGADRGGREDVIAWRRWARAEGACLPLDPRWQAVPDRDLRALTRRLEQVFERALQPLARRSDQVLAHQRRRLYVVSLRSGELLASARDDDEPALDRISRT